MTIWKQLEKELQRKVEVILPLFSFTMKKMRKCFSSSSKSNKFKKIKCDFCRKRFPDEIQHRLRNFRHRVHVECPNCGASLDVYDF